MLRLTQLLVMLWLAVIMTTASNEDDMATASNEDESYTTEMGYSTVLVTNTFLSTEELETTRNSSTPELSTRGKTTIKTNKATNTTATTKHFATSPTETQPPRTSKASTKQPSTSTFTASEETSSVNVTNKSTVDSTTPVNGSPVYITQHVTSSKSTTTTPPDHSSNSYSPTNETKTENISDSGITSSEVTSTTRSTTRGDTFSSTLINIRSETHTSEITSSIQDGRLTSQAESTTDSPEANNNGFLLAAAGACGALVLIMGAVCLYYGAKKARRPRFWGSGANGSGVAEIGMIFIKTQSKENGLNLEEVDTGLKCSSDGQAEPKAKIKVQGDRNSTVVNRTLTTFTPGPENFKRAQDRNLRDMIVRKDDEDDFFEDGHCRDSIAL